MKSHVITAAMVGLVLGVIVEFALNAAEQIPLVGCLFAPIAILFGLGLPVLIGALAVAVAPARGLSAPIDGALAAGLAECISRLVGFCASLIFARSFFWGPRVLLPSVEPAARAMFAGVWSLGWFVVALLIAALLGAIGAVVYTARVKR